ncbi:MAG: CxxC-x17-CxxC domain-containing protein [Candidatus Paceibacterota bacterium]
MKNFDKVARQGRNNRFGDGNFRGDFSKKNFDDRERPQMYAAICSDCNKKCEVPFKPSEDKPVYCSRCFSIREETSFSDKSRGGNRERPKFQEKVMFNTICDKCGKRFEIPFKPFGDKPVYCNECFEKGGRVNNNSDKFNRDQFEILNIKLDKIIKILSSISLIKKDDIVERESGESVVKKKSRVKKIKKTADKKSIGKKKKIKK